MAAPQTLDIFLVAAPGFENALLEEVRECKFSGAKRVSGGVAFRGQWRDVWRANLELRGVTRVLARLGSFHAAHLAQLDKRARKFPWAETFKPEVPVRVEVTCRKSKIYHSKAAAQRIETALREEASLHISDDADVVIKARIEDDLVTLSVDTSGESLHKRGHKEAVNKAPMRETLASLILRQCEFNGEEPVFDPMCGSGTFVIEAAEIAARLWPGRSRAFAFEQLVTFRDEKWQALKQKQESIIPAVRFYGADRDQGAVTMAKANAERAGVAAFTQFRRQSISEMTRPDGPPGLVVINPPYGTRIGERKPLFGLYGALGKTLQERFSGWRVGLITSDASLAKASGLPFVATEAPVLHGGLRVRLSRTAALP